MITTFMGIAKSQLKKKAILLRKQGLSYREIMAKIPVAKSTISVWLYSIGLSKKQKQRLTLKRIEAVKRSATTKHQRRIDLTKKIMDAAQSEAGRLTHRELWLAGIMLYWAEGAKEKDHRPGSGVRFTNTDPEMISLFLKWLSEICGKDLSDITFSLYIHGLQKHRTSEIVDFWTKTIGCKKSYFRYIYYKKGNPKTLRKNVGASYHGTLRVSVKSSSLLCRRIAGWTRGVIDWCR